MSDREFLIEANIQDVLKYIIADFDLSITVNAKIKMYKNYQIKMYS